MRMIRFFLAAACIAGFAVTALGMLAPLLPAADSVNHFRPWTLAALVVLLMAALAARDRRAVAAGLLLCAAQAALVLLPALWSATGSGASPSKAADARRITLVTFNMAWAARPIADVASYLLQQNADLVLLQEVTQAHAATLDAGLATAYPHRYACGGAIHACTQLLLAKRPWASVEHENRSGSGPELISARFDDPALGRLHLVGVHLAWPYTPAVQARQIDRLIRLRRATDGAMIIAGDFNLTPWSYQLQRALWLGDLRQHAMFLRTWPTDGQLRLPLPILQIDHVISTPDIRTVSIKTGPNLGSDHLPVLARLELPAGP